MSHIAPISVCVVHGSPASVWVWVRSVSSGLPVWLTALNVQVRRCSPRPLPTRHRPPSCAWWAQSWSRSTSETGPSWCGSSSGWRRSTRPPSSSSTRSMPSAPRGIRSYFRPDVRDWERQRWWRVSYGVGVMTGGWEGVISTVFIFVQHSTACSHLRSSSSSSSNRVYFCLANF